MQYIKSFEEEYEIDRFNLLIIKYLNIKKIGDIMFQLIGVIYGLLPVLYSVPIFLLWTVLQNMYKESILYFNTNNTFHLNRNTLDLKTTQFTLRDLYITS